MFYFSTDRVNFLSRFFAIARPAWISSAKFVEIDSTKFSNVTFSHSSRIKDDRALLHRDIVRARVRYPPLKAPETRLTQTSLSADDLAEVLSRIITLVTQIRSSRYATALQTVKHVCYLQPSDQRGPQPFWWRDRERKRDG